MRTLSILAICFLMLGFTAKAQTSYTFKASTAAYAPLTGATSATGGKLWDDATDFAFPLGFNFRLNGITTQTMYLSGSLLHPSLAGSKQSGFLVMNTSLMDRGTIQGTPKSPVRYTTTGAAGSRIFKLEFANAGFQDEFAANEELKDSVSFQIWLYEGSDAVEYRFGGSDIQGFNDYFSGKLLTGYVRNLDTLKGTFDKFFYLNGTPAAPSFDSTTTIPMNKGLGSFPANGQVYRYTPKGSTTAVEQVATYSLATVFPTRCQSQVQIRNTSGSRLQAALYGIDGRLLLTTDLANGDTAIDLSALANGQYILQLLDPAKGRSETQRIEKI